MEGPVYTAYSGSRDDRAIAITSAIDEATNSKREDPMSVVYLTGPVPNVF